MAQAVADRVSPEAGRPTEATPEVGSVVIRVGDQDVLISEIEHWVEDGLHVFRSTEFDCYAEHEDEAQAVVIFLANAEDLFFLLDDLVDAERATRDEMRTLVKLSRRFFEVYQACEREEKRRRKHRLLSRSRGEHSPFWRRQTTPSTSSQPSHA